MILTSAPKLLLVVLVLVFSSACHDGSLNHMNGTGCVYLVDTTSHDTINVWANVDRVLQWNDGRIYMVVERSDIEQGHISFLHTKGDFAYEESVRLVPDSLSHAGHADHLLYERHSVVVEVNGACSADVRGQ